MSFGDHLKPASDLGSAKWVRGACTGTWGTVGALVPNHYESVLRVHPTDPGEHWLSRYCDLFHTVASIGARHTSTPDRCWFAIWEGHGFDITAELDLLPTLKHPNRGYYVVGGPSTAVTELQYPDWNHWSNPDLFWPDDQQWFVATDVDFWSLYVGGSHDFLTELASGVPTSSELVGFDAPLPIEV